MEHSFQEVMKEHERMCHTIINANNDCYDCPLQKARLAIGEIGTCYRYFVEHYNDAKNIVMSWAAEHPEPVYPTWGDWLAEIGLISWQNNGDGVYSVMVPTFKMCKPIPADIAQKLGIEAKEG